MDFVQFWGFWAQFWPKTEISSTFQLDHQVSPKDTLRSEIKQRT